MSISNEGFKQIRSAQSQAGEVHQQPVTLTMLFYVVTVAAILAACFRYVSLDQQVTTRQIIVGCMIGGILGLSVGTVMMFWGQPYRWQPPLLGMFVGVVTGPLMQVRLTQHLPMAVIAFVGAWIVLTFATLAARLNEREKQ